MEKVLKTYDFYLDTKVTTWYRTPFSVLAENEEQAKLKAVHFVEEDEHSNYSWEQIDDTIEGMSVGDNGGNATEELYYNSGDMIWDNIKTK